MTVLSTIKLTVTGAGGVGKTTLAGELATRLGLPLIPELSRELCHEMGHKYPGEVVDQEGFKRRVLEKQIETEAMYPSFIADRSAIDCWVLWQRWNICQAMTYDTEAIYERVAAHATTYSHIVYIPPLFTPQEDDFRWTEPDYIKQIDRIIRMTFYDLNLREKVLTIGSKDFTARVQDVLAWLKDSKRASI